MSPTDGQRLPPRLVAALSLAILGAAAALLWWQIDRVWPFFSDDSFISLRYVERFLEGKGITWNDGERVEGSSNLLWLLGCAALGGLGLDLVLAARVLGASCVAMTFVVLLRAFPPTSLRALPAAAVGPLLLASSPPLQVWTCGGLEGSMVLLWVTWGSVRLLRLLQSDLPPTRRQLLAGSWPFALLCLTRPDTPLWAGVAAAALCWNSEGLRVAFARLIWFLALPALAVLLQLAFRLAYYGDWVPNTAHVKAQFSPAGFVEGLRYVGGGLWVMRGALLLALTAALPWVQPRTRKLALALIVPILVWCAYVAAIRGDHFWGWRHLFAPLAALALLAALGLRDLGNAGPWPLLLAAILALAGQSLLLVDTRRDPKTNSASGETWEWQGEVLGTALGRAFAAERPLLAIDSAGALPYFSRLPCLDMLGLNDRTIATKPSKEHVPPGALLPPAHTHGNGTYVMDRAPDLMLFGPPPCMPLAVTLSAYQFEDDRRFLDGYRCVLLVLPPAKLRSGQEVKMRTPLWVRVDGRAGTRRGEQQIEVPAMLLGSYRQPYAFGGDKPPQKGDANYDQWHADVGRCGQWYAGTPAVVVPDADGRLHLELRAHATAVLEGLDVPAGRFRPEAVPPNASLDVAAMTAGQAVTQGGDGAFDWSGGRLDLACTVKAGASLPQRVAMIVLRRLR